ncbi:putative Lon, substrate-binding domain, PUA-like superfamily [Arabidopsis thaliana]
MLFSTAELNGESLNPITAIHIFPMTSTLISSNLSSSFFPTQNIHRIRIPTTSIPGSFNIRARRSKIVAKSLDLPLLPFSMSEVLVPTESKTLHLYEARYLALLEESMKRKKNMFVHFILDPISISETATEASFAARYGCLVLIENVERLDVGALVSIRGAGRVKISRFLGADPYLSGEVRPIQDRMNYESSNELTSKISQLKESIKNLNSLEIKLKVEKILLLHRVLLGNNTNDNIRPRGCAPADSPLQTRLINSLNWAEDEPPVDFDESFVPSLQERLSFSAFQPISGSTKSELSRLQQEKIKAMDMKDTIERLELSMGLIKENISSIAAKLAIQSLDIR